jgi:hypothetical protein
MIEILFNNQRATFQNGKWRTENEIILPSLQSATEWHDAIGVGYFPDYELSLADFLRQRLNCQLVRYENEQDNSETEKSDDFQY